MNVKEKILLVQLLLEDIRGNWGYWGVGKDVEERALKAQRLCEEIAIELCDDQYTLLAHSCAVYISSSKDCGDWDGRWFRDIFPYGYKNMDEQHGLKNTFCDKSHEFKAVAEEYLTYPENRFEDWKDRFDD